MDTNDFMSRGRVSNQTGSEAPKKHKGPRGMMKIAMASMIISVALLISAVMAFVIFGGSTSESELIKEDQYQAVFLNDQNGQVYFGKLSLVNSKFYRLTDIFYVRVEQVQPDTGEAAQNISLAKLGSELHGPEDEMFIAKDKVLFWENLKDDGKVVTAIEDYKKNGSDTTTTENTDSTDTTTE
ncbi:MAG: hypothetical protein AAB624_03685 [Patescibacteria group bacterium]